MTNWTMVITGGRGGGRGHGGIYAKYYDQPVVLITPRAEILLPPETYRQIGSPEAVHLYVDPRDMKFAIESAKPDERNIYVVQLRHGGKTLKNGEKPKHPTPMTRIAAASFVKGSGLVVEDHVVILKGALDDDGKFVVDMRQRREIDDYHRRTYRKKSNM